MRSAKQPRVTVLERSENYFEGRYKQHDIRIDRTARNPNWYIVVRGPDGCYACDGWWRDSADKTMDEAILEACRGSLLWPARAATPPHKE